MMKARITILAVVVSVWLANSGCDSGSVHENHQVTSHEHSDEYLKEVVQPVNEFVLSNQATVKPTDGNSDQFLSVTGYITVDARRNQEVASRVSGRIEKLYIRYNYQHVRKGEKIADLYSPELNTYLREYLFVRKTSDDSSIVKGAKEKLILLGVHPDQLSRIEGQDSIALTIEIVSPIDGFVIFSNSANTSTVENSKSEMSSMNEGSSTSDVPVTTVGRIREGNYVNQGQTLFYVNDLKEVWGILAFTAGEQKLITRNLPVEIVSELIPDSPLNGKIDFIEPVFDEGQKFLQARVYLRNPKLQLKPESLLNAEVRTSVNGKLLLPNTSVQHLGKHDIVWKRIQTTESGSIFQATIVTTGFETGDLIEILAGLRSTDEVARDAAYLMDSQSLLDLR